MMKDSLLILASQILMALFNLAASAFLARNLSMDGLGEYQLILAYLGVASIAALPGMNTAIYKSVLKGYDSIYGKAQKRVLVSVLICSGLLMTTSWIYTNVRGNFKVGQVLFFLSLLLPATGFQKYDSVLLPKCRFVASRLISVLSSFLTAIVIGLTSFYTHDFKAVLLAFIGINGMLTIAGHFIAKMSLGSAEPKNDEEKKIFRQGWEFSLLAVFNTIVLKIDRIILGVIDPRYLAVYYIGTIMPRIVKDNLKNIAAVPISWWGRKTPQDNIQKLLSNWYKILLFGVCLSAIIIAAAPVVLPIFFGEEYRKSVIIAQVLSLTIPTNILAAFVFSFDTFQRRGRYVQIHSYIQKIFYCLSLVIFLQFWKIKAVIFSILLMELYRGVAAIVYLFIILKRSNSIDAKEI
ncbi:MAG: oligosaccharide flippase family protein [Chitinivibrionales bacterium]|nr:oligosaccharide flippase family protein [Chitinivibrionales bacterium]